MDDHPKTYASTDIAELPPNVSVFIPPRDAFSSSGTGSRTSQLICQATGFSPKKVSVSWFRDGKPVKDGINTGTVETESKAPGPMTYRITSRLTITESDWLNQNVFTCQVEHLGLSYQKNVSSVCGAGECSFPENMAPEEQRRTGEPTHRAESTSYRAEISPNGRGTHIKKWDQHIEVDLFTLV